MDTNIFSKNINTYGETFSSVNLDTIFTNWVDAWSDFYIGEPSLYEFVVDLENKKWYINGEEKGEVILERLKVLSFM